MKTWKEVKENWKSLLQQNVDNAWVTYVITREEMEAVMKEIERLEDKLLGRE